MYKVGDRVRVYSCSQNGVGVSAVGTLIEILGCAEGSVRLDSGTKMYVHVKQMRKLKIKSPREIVIQFGEGDYKGGEVVTFREIKGSENV